MPTKENASSRPPAQVPFQPPPEQHPPGSKEDWLAKNARAKAIIMSTLIPGSEPWKIAEPLEYAADIWKALEDRYAPKDDPVGQRLERADFVNDWVEGKSMDKYRDSAKSARMLENFPADALNPEIISKLSKPDLKDISKKKREIEVKNKARAAGAVENSKDLIMKELKRKEAQEAAAKVMREHMPNRDQRFLWAVLHGGKQETMDWFNGATASDQVT